MARIEINDNTINIRLSNNEEMVSTNEILNSLYHFKVNVNRLTMHGSSTCVYRSFKEYAKRYKDSQNHIKFMDDALSEAYTGIERNDGGPFGSVVVMNGQIIGKGHNCVLKDNDPTAHGEIMAIRDACKNYGKPHLDGAILYTTSYPCPMCLATMMWAHINTFYFGCTIEDAKRIGFDDSKFYERFNNTKSGGIHNTQIMHHECLQLFDYYQTLNLQKY